MKIITNILILFTILFLKSTSLAADTPRVSPSPIELVMNCGTTYSNKFDKDTFIESVDFGSENRSTNIAIEVIFRNVGENSVWPHTLFPNLSIVWDGKEYTQRLQHEGWSEDPVGSHETRRNIYFLSIFNIPSEARTSGRHTVAVRDTFPEADTVTISNDYSISPAHPQSNMIIFAESSTLTVFINNPL